MHNHPGSIHCLVDRTRTCPARARIPAARLDLDLPAPHLFHRLCLAPTHTCALAACLHACSMRSRPCDQRAARAHLPLACMHAACAADPANSGRHARTPCRLPACSMRSRPCDQRAARAHLLPLACMCAACAAADPANSGRHARTLPLACMQHAQPTLRTAGGTRAPAAARLHVCSMRSCRPCEQRACCRSPACVQHAQSTLRSAGGTRAPAACLHACSMRSCRPCEQRAARAHLAACLHAACAADPANSGRHARTCRLPACSMWQPTPARRAPSLSRRPLPPPSLTALSRRPLPPPSHVHAYGIAGAPK